MLSGHDGPTAQAVDLTSALAGAAITGPSADLVLSSVSGLDTSPDNLPDMSCAQGEAVGVHGILVRADREGYPGTGSILAASTESTCGRPCWTPDASTARFRWERRRWRVSNGRVGVTRMVLRLFRKDRVWDKRPLKRRYDVVIIGAGVHGLSTAYYLAKQGVKNVAVIDKGYVGGGASARTTAIIRANYLTPQGVAFFRESLKLYEGLAADLDFNILFSQMGRLDLGHADSSIYGLRQRAEVNRLLGVDSRMVGPSEIKELIPCIDLREGKTLPIIGALYHPPGGVVRHDAVVWGFGRGAARQGVEIHPFTEVTAIARKNGRVTESRPPAAPWRRGRS